MGKRHRAKDGASGGSGPRQAAAPQGSGSAPHWQPTFQKLLTGRCFCFASAACDSALRYEPKRWATPRTRGLAKFDSTPLSAAMKALKPQKAAAPRTRHPGIAACCKACPCSRSLWSWPSCSSRTSWPAGAKSPAQYYSILLAETPPRRHSTCLISQRISITRSGRSEQEEETKPLG